MTSPVYQRNVTPTSCSTAGMASTSSRPPLSELPLSLFLAPLPEFIASTNNKEKRPSSPLKPRSLLSMAGPTTVLPMSPAKRRVLASDMSTLKPSIRSDSEEKTPRSVGTRVGDEDDGEGVGVGVVEEDEVQRRWECKSPARRLFVDDDGQGVSASPRRSSPRNTPHLSQFTTEPNFSSSYRLAPSPPISERGTSSSPSSSMRKNRSLGSPTTPRPTKKPRLPTSSNDINTTTTTATAGPSTPPRLSSTSHTTTPRSSKRRINLLSDLEDDLFSPSTPNPRTSSTDASGGSRSRTRSVSIVHEPTEWMEDNADPNACGFVIWNDDDDDRMSGERIDEDEVDSGRFLRGTNNSVLSTTGALHPPISINPPTMSSDVIPDDDGSSLHVDQENRPPSRSWMERKVAVAVEVSVVETLVIQTATRGEIASEDEKMMAFGIQAVQEHLLDVDMEMI